ncbi:MAG: YdcF family protein [Cyclobacteriaceae bacterium]|nr:YdcF family protein [Cyclobacteriaceae bacterium]
MKFYKRKIIKILAFASVSILVVITLSNALIIESTKSNIYYSIENVPHKQVALILGTSNKLLSGEDNPFFHTRISMAANLYKSGVVKHLLVSGDNRSKYYNEPLKMKNALIELGVPETAISLDYAGLRTLDSIVRSKEIFGQDDIIIVTQEFHCYRALFISNYYDIEAIAIATAPVPRSLAFKTIFREIFARTKAIWDTYIVNKSPKHLGEKELIIIEA